MANTTIVLKGPRSIDLGVTIDTIPNIALNIGQTRDMSQYINDDGDKITDSQILNLDTNLATYSHSTKLLTGVSNGTSANLQLEVSYD